MWVYEYFEGDKRDDFVMDIQFEMYSYASSLMFDEVYRAYLLSEYAVMYLDSETIARLRLIERYDHRLMQIPHDTLAAVFRYQTKNGKFLKELFEPDEDKIISYHKLIFSDVNFLRKIEKCHWYLTIKWLEFLKETINNNKGLIREIANAVIVYNSDYADAQKAWDAAYRSNELIINEFNEIPWILK